MKVVMTFMMSIVMSNAIYVRFESFPSEPKLKPIKGVYDYHRRIGIPLAEKIKYREYKVMKRITEGSITEIGVVPYQAGLITTVLSKHQSVCGGCLISESRILTAAHCQSDGVVIGQYMTVVLGSSLLFSGGTRVDATDVVVNSKYDPVSAQNDIAIVRFPKVKFTSLIQPVALPWGKKRNMDFLHYMAVASGFGKTGDEHDIGMFQTVSAVTVRVISNDQCMESYGETIHKQHLCTSGEWGRGTCAGDSGGPLVVEINSRPVLIGITSFGADSCDLSTPSAFVRVTAFLPWIRQKLQSN